MFSPALIVLIIIAWIIMISFLVIPVLAIRYPDWTKKVLMRLVSWGVPKFSWWASSHDLIIERADNEINNLFSSMSRFAGNARIGLMKGGIMTLCFWVVEFLVASVILMGLGLAPYVVESFFFQIVIAIINMIPLTPGSSGITELWNIISLCLTDSFRSNRYFCFVMAFRNILPQYRHRFRCRPRNIQARDRKQERG